MKICIGGEEMERQAVVRVGSALPCCQLVVRWTGRSSQGSLQWFPLHSYLCFAFGGISGLWFQGNSSPLPISMAKLPIEETSLFSSLQLSTNPAQRQSDRHSLQRHELLENKICPSNLPFGAHQCHGARQLQLGCSQLSDPPRQLWLGMDTQLSQLLGSFLGPQSSAGISNQALKLPSSSSCSDGRMEDGTLGTRLCPCSAGSAPLKDLVSSTERNPLPQDPVSL